MQEAYHAYDETGLEGGRRETYWITEGGGMNGHASIIGFSFP